MVAITAQISIYLGVREKGIRFSIGYSHSSIDKNTGIKTIEKSTLLNLYTKLALSTDIVIYNEYFLL